MSNHRREQLLEVLDRLVVLLEAAGDSHWSTWMRKSRDLIERDDVAGADYLMSAYGGMGSFDDWWADGPEDAEIGELRRRAYQLAAMWKADWWPSG